MNSYMQITTYSTIEKYLVTNQSTIIISMILFQACTAQSPHAVFMWASHNGMFTNQNKNSGTNL